MYRIALCLVFSLAIGIGVAVPVAVSQEEASNAPNQTGKQEQGTEPKPEFGDDSPENALRSFYSALKNGDAVTAKSLLTAPEKLTEWVDIQIKVSNAFRQFGDAAVAHFGDEGKVFLGGIPSDSLLKKLDTLKPTQDGDSARWAINPQVPMKLVREDGHWKLDLFASPNDDDQVKQQNRTFSRIADYVGQIATDVKDGKFATIAAVRAELKKQREAMNRDLGR